MTLTVLSDLRDTTILIYLFLTISILHVATALPAYPDTPTSQGVANDETGNYIASSDTGGSWYSADLNSGAATSAASGSSPESYECYGGLINAYPSMNDWMSFNALWKLNEPTLQLSNTAEQNKHIYEAIIQVSQESKVDARIILALIMQESTGKVNAPCTGAHNCGLLQAGKGSVSFDPANPRDSILQMIRDGINGSGGEAGSADVWPGITQYLYQSASMGWTNIRNPGNPYEAFRAYNSGHVRPSGNLDEISGGSTSSYVNDIANRLMGWDGSGSGCAQAKCGLRPQSDCAGVGA